MKEPSTTSLAAVREVSLQQRRRVAEVRAREHVGAAGWAQSSALESIIQAGREGLAATDALRQIVNLMTTQLRALPLNAPGEARSEHARALQEILESSEAQSTAAQLFDTLVSEALDAVARTPVDDLSLARLKTIRARVQQQVATLEVISQSAKVQAATLEQFTALDRVSAEFQGRVESLQHLSAQAEAQVLGEAGRGLVERLGELSDAVPEQVEALTSIGEAVAEQLTVSSVPNEEHVKALEQLANLMEERAEEIRTPATGQH